LEREKKNLFCLPKTETWPLDRPALSLFTMPITLSPFPTMSKPTNKIFKIVHTVYVCFHTQIYHQHQFVHDTKSQHTKFHRTPNMFWCEFTPPSGEYINT
jgi:hypothetical protein